MQNFSAEGFDFTPLAGQLGKYINFEDGMYLPDPVPEDLLLPFRDFVTKFSLQDVAYTIALASEGDDYLLDELTLYVFQRFNNVLIEELTAGNGFKTLNNSELYFKAQAELGPNALVQSTVIAGNRTSDGVELLVQTPTGNKLIIASAVLVSCPLVIENMAPFGLDNSESSLFTQFTATGYYTFLLGNTNLPPGFSYENVAPDGLYNIPALPTVLNIRTTLIDGIYYGWYGSHTPVSESEVKREVISTVQRLSNSSAVPTILEFASHSPFKQTVSADSIRDGFYTKLNGLQGHKNTWYTGNAVDESGTSNLWNFTEQLLPNIAAVATKQPSLAEGVCEY
jgi:hypothetical protein